jgi:hypothetical protein
VRDHEADPGRALVTAGRGSAASINAVAGSNAGQSIGAGPYVIEYCFSRQPPKVRSPWKRIGRGS